MNRQKLTCFSKSLNASTLGFHCSNKMVVSEWAKHFFFGSIVCKNNNYQPQEKFYALHHHSNCKICRMTLSQQVLKINVRFIKSVIQLGCLSYISMIKITFFLINTKRN